MAKKRPGISLWKGGIPSWLPSEVPAYTVEQELAIARYEHDLAEHLSSKPKRLRHSLSVGYTAQQMALAYGCDPYLARVAGIFHDWSKLLSHDQTLTRARELGIELEADLELVEPLLHGMIAARELPALYPEVEPCVWQAVDRHTLGNADMSELDMLVFVADGIEPFRKDAEPIERQRGHVGKLSLGDLYWESFSDGISYVVDTRRYLYPGTLAIYNELVLSRKSQRN